MPELTVEARSEARVALEAARDHLLSLQDEAGWWRGELQTNVTMDAEDLLLREFLGIRGEEQTARSAAWIRSQQRADGTWANFFEGPGDLSTTIEAYWALRLAGDDPDDEHMRTAAEFVREHGGVAEARVFTHLWLALFGLWSWDRVPALPAEIVLLPNRFPLNVYDFACWARQTIVALSLVKAHRPCRPLPFRLDELELPRTAAARAGSPGGLPAPAAGGTPAVGSTERAAAGGLSRPTAPRSSPAQAKCDTSAAGSVAAPISRAGPARCCDHSPKGCAAPRQALLAKLGRMHRAHLARRSAQ